METYKEKNTNYKYKIVMTYTQSNGKAIKIEHDKIMTLIIDNDYDKRNMPITLVRVVLDKRTIDDMISKKNRILILEISKFKEDSNVPIYKKILKDEFYYFLDNNMNYFDDLDYANNENKENKDITKVITIGLMRKKILDTNKVMINTVYRNTTSLDIIVNLFKEDVNILVEPFDGKRVHNFIVTPTDTLTKFISYINDNFTLYKTPYRFYYDLNGAYLVSSSGKGTPSKKEKYNTVHITISNVTSNESKIEGMTEDSANKCYKLYVDMANINVSTDNTTELNYNKIIAVDSEGNQKTVTIDNTDMKGERYKTSRLSNTNLDSLENLKYKVDLNSTIVNIVKEQLESDVFTINKQYFIKNKTDNTNIPSGRYLLSTKKEIYVKDAESFNMTSIFSFKKCPST